ncbi:MAG: hypothetical protein A3D65_05040 [Candidatus Lloydbacteria bacterium RIFCSPHIGHO2_02_FULL_50_13]|uniref:Four helix bundle protein n=1 Tax=Candidatus Lloydbacteria bacterium RIFCSPHIGHO2_02_FULL_50_13 TaxID=1798661 RepID=A0A1G2D4X7_9BACT|nr:MAG: hypothetical protein A3D65_05040 [Candidatus Lloydbacteria bacterium RIFCSPHIGHO2_02_FULL_50_13]
MEEKAKIKNFYDLVAWQKAHQLTLLIYKITEHFPRAEQFSLVSQMRRAAISLGSNIAEGFGRGGMKDKAQFYLIAQGSLYELQSQMFVAHDLGYWSDLTVFHKLADETGRLLSGIIKSAVART